MQSTCEYNYPRYMKVLVKRFYDDFMDEYHGIFFGWILLHFFELKWKWTTKKIQIQEAMKALQISSLVDNYIRIFEFQILSSTYNPKYHYTNYFCIISTNLFSQIPISTFLAKCFGKWNYQTTTYSNNTENLYGSSTKVIIAENELLSQNLQWLVQRPS